MGKARATKLDLAKEHLEKENIIYLNTGGRSQENRRACFVPVFKDCETDIIYPSNFEDGRRAPFHCLDGLPDDAFTEQESPTLRNQVIAGFMRNGIFYTREEASELIQKIGLD